MSWPFDEFDMKPGSLHEVRASCTFAERRDGKIEIEFVQVPEGAILMSLGYEDTPDDRWSDFEFKFLYGEKEIFLPIALPADASSLDKEELVEQIQITLFAFVKPMSHGYAMPKTFHRTPSLIGDSRGDDDGYDEFH